MPTKPSRGVGGAVIVIAIIVIAILSGIFFSTRGKTKPPTPKGSLREAVTANMQPSPPKFPTTGEGSATADHPVKAWLDPMRSHTRPSRSVRYVFVEDASVSWDEIVDAPIEQVKQNLQIWWRKPAGRYLIYPLNEGDKIFFRWY